jgi:hypothetical protein
LFTKSGSSASVSVWQLPERESCGQKTRRVNLGWILACNSGLWGTMVGFAIGLNWLITRS